MMIVDGWSDGSTRASCSLSAWAHAWSFYAMTGWTPDVSQSTIVGVGVVRASVLASFRAVEHVTLSTLAPEQRTEGAGLFSLSRNIGSSIAYRW